MRKQPTEDFCPAGNTKQHNCHFLYIYDTRKFKVHPGTGKADTV